jgi:broad specificity phosphatase PhoE
MKLILTRHGETIENTKKIGQGHMPGRLTANGKRQARKVAFKLRKERIDCIYSSDLARAFDTAKIISKYHKKAPLIPAEELKECDLKGWTGKKYPITPKERKRMTQLYGKVESRVSMRRRAKKMLDKAYSRFPNGCVLFVGHNGINKALISVIMRKPASYMSKIHQHNTAVNIFEIREDGKHKIHLLNCKKHLEE